MAHVPPSPKGNMHGNPSSSNGSRNAQADIEHPRSGTHNLYLREEASVATSDQGTLSRAAAITSAIPAPAMT